MTQQLEDALQQVKKFMHCNDLESAANLLNTLREQYPTAPTVARIWCALAKRSGQTAEVPAYATKIYTQVQDDIHKARWAMEIATANFILLDLTAAKDNFTCALQHLLSLIKTGKAPRKKKSVTAKSNLVNIFSSGTAEQLLWTTCAQLASLGIKAFPFAGTLLGIVREGHLLDFDKDLDIAVWMESFDACCNALEQLGWSKVPVEVAYSNYRGYVHKEIGITIDVCGLQHRNQQQITGGFALPDYGTEYQRVSVFPSFELITRSTDYGQVWFPQSAENILTAFYGDWRTPNPNWDTVVSALNLENYTLLVQCYAYYRLVHHWLSGDLTKAWGYALQIGLKDPDDLLVLNCRQWLERTLLQSGQEIPIWPQNSSKRRIYTRLVGDLFHQGHINFLQAARALGSHLTVCVVPDARVLQNKGKQPVMTQAERVAVVSACRYVDTVITESPVNATLEFMQSNDFHVYTFACASEQEKIEKYQQCAALPTSMIQEIEYTAGISTSDLVTRILQGAGQSNKGSRS